MPAYRPLDGRIDPERARATLDAERARLLRGARRGDRRAGPDDLRVAGRGRDARSSSSSATSPCATARPPSSSSSRRRWLDSTRGPSGPASAAASRSRRRASRPSRGPPTASTARPSARPRDADDRRARSSRSRTSGPPRPGCAGSPSRTPLLPYGPPDGSALPQGREPAADRRVQAPRRVLRDRRACRPRRSRARRHHLLVGQPRPGRRPRRSAARARRPWWSCRPTLRRSSATASRPTAPRSSSSGTASDERQRVAEEIAADRGLAIIPPFDDDRIIAGQGTIGLELVEDLPDLAAVLVPIGGGGLASGVATAVKALRPDARVIGVEPELAADAQESLERGEIVRWPAERVSRTIADGTRTQAHRCAGRSPTCAPISTRSSRCRRPRSPRPCGWPPRGAARRRAIRRPGRSPRWRSAPTRPASTGSTGPVVAVVSGGNVDPDALPRLPGGAAPA